MSMLSKGKQKIDVMILNVHLSNSSFVDLLAQAEALNIISLVVCDESNEVVAKKTLNDGAYFYLKKPFDKKIVSYLWQFVLGEKVRKEKAREGSGKHKDHMKVKMISTNNIVGENKESEEKNVSYSKAQNNNIHEARKDVALSGKYTLQRKRGTKGMKQNSEGERQNNVIDKVVRRKDYREWTEDLHATFMQAVRQLGEGRCYPKEILQVMSLPGLTRMQVASHLQKCRRNNWRSPKERKYIRHLSIQRPIVTSHETRSSSFQKFGVMPYPQANVPNQQRNPNQIQRGPEFPFPTHNTNNIFTQGESSIQRQLYRPQFQVQHHNLSIDNSFLSPQTNVSGGIQQHGPLFEMLGLQRLQDSITGNTNFRPDMLLNNGANHSEKNYNFNLNVAQGATYSGSRIVSGTYIGNAIINNYNLNVTADNVTTYSSSAMMSDTYVGNVTINDLRGTNVNASSQQYVGEPIMYGPRNIDVASYDNYVEGSNSNEKENCDAHLNFNNMDNLFQNLGPSSANLPNEQGIEFDQVYFDDQILGLLSANLPNELGSEFDQVYSDNQNLEPPSANLPNEQDNEFDQVYSDDQNLGPSSANLPNEQGNEFDQVYSDD
ncbi:hypothetical protein MTR67_014107 [Solanum verrucosum]|uniref:Uncharacterized protein n=1 Tax=Solanum verrucosum TaxID=315347 RepID=A0AAF0THI2_SOLVR|nr:hypothetical protein MTR67_014107 [Solanum verrucosum]